MTSLAPAQAATAPHTVAIPEDPLVRAAFSRRATGNISLLVGSNGTEAGGRGGRGSAQGPEWPGSALQARARLARAVGLDAGDVVFAEQVHGCGVALVGGAERGRGAADPATAMPGVDALVTAQPGVALAVLAADCVPLLLAAPGRAVAAVHAGRKGLVAGVVPAALDVLLETAAVVPGAVVAIVGPAIGGCCYEVPADMARRVAATHPATAATTTWGAPALELRAGVVAALERRGVGRIEEVGACTRCGDEGWFSARGSVASTLGDAGPPGRHAGIICRGGQVGPVDGGDRLRTT